MRLKNFFISSFFLLLNFSLLKAQYFDVKKGNEMYKKGDYEKAQTYYSTAILGVEDIEDKKEAIFNTGDALYRKKSFDEAKKKFLSVAENKELEKTLRSEAYYNLGNTAYQKSEATKDPKEKQKNLKEAMDYLKKSMQLNPSDMDAKQNFEYLKQLLQKMQSQSQNQKNNQQNQDQKKDKKKQNKQQKDKSDKQEKQNQSQDKSNKEKGNNKNKKQSQPEKQFTRKQAERLLDAIKQDEKKMLKKYQKKQVGTKNIDKDW